jgi:flagellar basal-body rod modification protein FlgD
MAVSSTVSDIQSATAAKQDATNTANANKNTTLDKSAFLSLLTEQLKNQDPTQPMDNTAFVAQLAQFSSLEQMSNVNDNLTKLITTQSTSLQTTAASMVGKTAVFESDEVVLEKDKPAVFTATLSQAAANVAMVIQNSEGKTVRTSGLGALPSGVNPFSWDGLDDSGKAVAPGAYTVALTATDINGKAVSLTQNGSARITGITYDNGTPEFQAGGHTLKLSDISELHE